MVREISCNLSEKWVELPWELRSGTSWASSDKGLKDFCAIRLVTSKCWVDCFFFLHNRVEKKHRCQKMFCVFVTWLYDVIGSNSKKKFFSEKVCNYTSWKRALKMP